jgi:hypothetical protein
MSKDIAVNALEALVLYQTLRLVGLYEGRIGVNKKNSVLITNISSRKSYVAQMLSFYPCFAPTCTNRSPGHLEAKHKWRSDTKSSTVCYLLRALHISMTTSTDSAIVIALG